MEQGKVNIKHLPTKYMWIKINTKPKTGLPFRQDRAKLMNCTIDLQDHMLAHNVQNNKGVNHDSRSEAYSSKEVSQLLGMT